MSQISCPECGQSLSIKNHTCPECGFPINLNVPHNHNQSIGPDVADEGDNEAERIMRNYLNFIKNLIIISSVIFGIFLFIAGIVAMSNGIPGGIAGLFGGIVAIILGIAIAKLIWASGMILINISTNVRTIKGVLKSR